MQTRIFSSSLLLLTLSACTQSAEIQNQSVAPIYEPKTAIDFDGLEVSGELVANEESMADEMAPAAEPVTIFQGVGGLGLRGVGQGGGGSFGSGSSAMGSASSANRTQRKARGRAAYRSAPSPTYAPPPPQNTEQYTNYGVNDMTDTTKDRFSTFSIDVDTASYTISRRKLQEGSLPPTSAVRVEEFVNYFPYQYAAPTTDMPFAVHMEAAPDPFNDGHHLFRVGIKAQDLDLSNRKPVHLTFLVDVSGSMSRPDKIGLAKRSLRLLTDQLRPGDTVALATYAGNVRAVLDPTDVRHKSQIHAAIEDLSAGGSTAMNSGIQLAYGMAQSSYVAGEENRVIVLSDGDANVGPSSHQDILKSIKGYAKNGITLSTIGFGMGNYKDTMMEQLANKGDGNYYYIDAFSEAKKVFGTNLAGTLQVIAKDVKIQVEFNPEAVSTYRLVGYENRDIADRDFRNDKVDAGEIGTGHTVTALYDLVLTGSDSEELATVRIRNKKPGPDSPAVEWMTTFDTDEVNRRFSQASPDFRIAVAAATFAEILRGSPYAAEITWEELASLASKAQRRGVSEDDELLSLIQRAAGLSGARGPTAER
jgi:Ca-activated chloride channel family protein